MCVCVFVGGGEGGGRGQVGGMCMYVCAGMDRLGEAVGILYG